FDAFSLPPDATGTSVVAGSPTVMEYTKTGDPDDSLVLTVDSASKFTGVASGKDSRFITYGQTKSGTGNDSALLDGSILRLDGPRAVVTLPADPMPANALYLVWPANADG